MYHVSGIVRGQQGWGSTIPLSQGEVLFLLTENPDGSTFPVNLQLGLRDPGPVVLVRTDRMANAAHHLADEYSNGGLEPTAIAALHPENSRKKKKEIINVKRIIMC